MTAQQVDPASPAIELNMTPHPTSRLRETPPPDQVRGMLSPARGEGKKGKIAR